MKYKALYNSPLGIIHLTSDGEFLTGLWFDGSKDSQKHIGEYEQKDLDIFKCTIKWLDIYFRGEEPDFMPKYKIENITPFRQRVIDIMCEIPYGKTITYNDIAKKIAHEQKIATMSAQAVGGAVGWNPICLIVPCHRVVGANGNLTGYGGGIENKIKLLEIEKVDMSKMWCSQKKP